MEKIKELKNLCRSWLETGLINEEQFKHIKQDLNIFINGNLKKKKNG